MAKQYIDIGGNKTVTVNVDDSAGADDDLSSYEGYVVALYYKHNGEVVQKYSKNSVTGYDSTNISTSDEANGNITIYITRSVSEDGEPDRDVWAQVLVQETDSNYGSSQYRDWGDPLYAFTWRQNHSLTTTTDIS